MLISPDYPAPSPWPERDASVGTGDRCVRCLATKDATNSTALVAEIQHDEFLPRNYQTISEKLSAEAPDYQLARLEPYYLLWCLRAMRADLLGRLAMGSTHKTIYVPDIQSLRIAVPPIEVQREIVSRIRQSNEVADAAIDLRRRHVVITLERKHSLVTAAVTGQSDVTAGESVR